MFSMTREVGLPVMSMKARDERSSLGKCLALWNDPALASKLYSAVSDSPLNQRIRSTESLNGFSTGHGRTAFPEAAATTVTVGDCPATASVNESLMAAAPTTK